MSNSSFHDYAQGRYDEEWNEYLDYVGLFNHPINMESVTNWLNPPLIVKGEGISDDARIAIVEYVKTLEEDEADAVAEPTPPDAAKTAYETVMVAARQEIIWTVIDDIQDSYTLAMQSYGISPAAIKEITGTVDDYAANNWGD
jgi:hypothetical protein